MLDNHGLYDRRKVLSILRKKANVFLFPSVHLQLIFYIQIHRIF